MTRPRRAFGAALAVAAFMSAGMGLAAARPVDRRLANIPTVVGRRAASVARAVHGYDGRRRPRAKPALVTTGAKLDCVYSANSEATLATFEQMVGRDVSCAQVYNNESQTWAQWTEPWFLSSQPDYAWAQWATAPGTDRRLVIDQSLIPTAVANANWRQLGADGAYRAYAQEFAANLVQAGLGSSIIRLSPEMNGTWSVDNVGTTPEQMRLWVLFWRQTVGAMRSVPGAHFTFDWSINAAVRPLSLSAFYPGNNFVDVVGVDAYDQGVAQGQPRWSTIYARPDGVEAVLTFAEARGKPLSFPEWGLASVSDGNGGGDDPSYVDGIASIVHDDNVAYQCYFYNGDFASQLENDSQSLAAYEAGFGSG